LTSNIADTESPYTTAPHTDTFLVFSPFLSRTIMTDPSASLAPNRLRDS